MGVREPAYFRIVPDEVEALVALGRLDEAESLLVPFEEAGRNLDRAWAIATGARCRALVLAARGDLAGASAAADEAVREHDRLPLPFELGRTLLVRGTVERRAKRKREARDTLTKALEVFDGLGAALWAEKARAELARIGGRAPSSLDLTPTEDRVAALVAGGSTNREVADCAVRQHPHGGGQPQADLPQAGRSLAHGAGLEVPIRRVRTLRQRPRDLRR